MRILAIRHQISEANNRENYGTPAFGNPDAPLMPQGREAAPEIGERLEREYGFVIADQVVATSMMRRTQETAIAAGFRWLHVYPELNEEKGGLPDNEIREALTARTPPEATVQAAHALIENPPQEPIWFAHGLLIATLCQELEVHQDQRFVPRFGEIRELPIDL